ncbi:ABC transporter substrate-binding protein [Alkalihalobacillus oceani]|uniref:ABC transporter substrate-binding protein n=1 Tax=Halalkalibacter oceani TaxID=1653776 RepID=A0A9X2DR09_9BACI|nr:ABC transporter substrate-binding protein [Halalkalibacter oceani]MCM3713847.1 ABC transporter substrate-binding protein [Halalkalibacter oceani]
MKQLKGILILTIVMFVLTACAQTGQEVQSNQPEQENEASAPEDNHDASPAAEANGGDGTLTIYTAGPAGLAEQLADVFSEETGIEVDLFQGTTGDILGRLEAEESNPITDVVVLASLPPAVEYKERGLTLAYESPHAASLHDGWYDDEFHYYGFSASALGLSYNTNVVTEPPTDWSDLTAAEYSGQLAIPDPTQSGTARDFIAAFINQEGEAGWELLEQLKENGLQMEGANNPALQTVISGANSVVMAGVDYMVYSNKANGEPVDIVFPKSGTMITPRPAFILESSQNVEAAKQYIDFILSEAGQEIIAEAYLIPGRADIEAADIAVGIEDIPTLEYDWTYLEEHTQEILERFMELIR